MHSVTSKAPPFLVSTKPPTMYCPKHDLYIFSSKRQESRLNLSLGLTASKRHKLSSVRCFAAAADVEISVGTTSTATSVRGRLHRLVSEFDSLTEPIDRVKRLLDYASLLPSFDESARSPANKVTGCTTQVWLEAAIDENGRMRFCADSDSEITKGFISCLLWLVDGAEPAEVVGVKAEDLVALNVGQHGKVQSRVNTWHNILTAMQNRTKTLVAANNKRQQQQHLQVETLAPLIVTGDGINGSGSLEESRFSKVSVSSVDFT